jgi:hypothetical protein
MKEAEALKTRITRFESDLEKARNDISGFTNQISNLT